jgi:hypothetical protein
VSAGWRCGHRREEWLRRVNADQALHDQFDVALPVARPVQRAARRHLPSLRSAHHHVEELAWHVAQVRPCDRGAHIVVERRATTHCRHGPGRYALVRPIWPRRMFGHPRRGLH